MKSLPKKYFDKAKARYDKAMFFVEHEAIFLRALRRALGSLHREEPGGEHPSEQELKHAWEGLKVLLVKDFPTLFERAADRTLPACTRAEAMQMRARLLTVIEAIDVNFPRDGGENGAEV